METPSGLIVVDEDHRQSDLMASPGRLQRASPNPALNINIIYVLFFSKVNKSPYVSPLSIRFYFLLIITRKKLKQATHFLYYIGIPLSSLSLLSLLQHPDSFDAIFHWIIKFQVSTSFIFSFHLAANNLLFCFTVHKSV